MTTNNEKMRAGRDGADCPLCGYDGLWGLCMTQAERDKAIAALRDEAGEGEAVAQVYSVAGRDKKQVALSANGQNLPDGTLLYTRPAPQPEGVTEAAITGALFDFTGFLTTRGSPITLSENHEAGPVVEALSEWAAKRGISLDGADVSGWTAALAHQPKE